MKAFMRGLNTTAPLKFDHPGLGSTATRSGTGAVIQNDIGTTDAHVLVVRVEEMQVSVAYTDVHLRRMKFFQSLLEKRSVEWDNTWSRHSEVLTEGETFYGTLGHYRGRDAIAVLKAAADANFGHRAFLELGAEQLVFEAKRAECSPHVADARRTRRWSRDRSALYVSPVAGISAWT